MSRRDTQLGRRSPLSTCYRAYARVGEFFARLAAARAIDQGCRTVDLGDVRIILDPQQLRVAGEEAVLCSMAAPAPREPRLAMECGHGGMASYRTGDRYRTKDDDARGRELPSSS